jgi:ATP-dependent HslUV protease ATP-binding subunit HslU
LRSLGRDDFKRILVEPQNALIKQYIMLLGTEDIDLNFTDDAIEEIANLACHVNDQTENIGVRRLYTIMERLLGEISFLSPEMTEQEVKIDAKYVQNQLADIIENRDLSRYIL